MEVVITQRDASIVSLIGGLAKQCCVFGSTYNEKIYTVDFGKEHHDQTDIGSLLSTNAIKIHCNTTSSTSITSEESTESSDPESIITTKNMTRVMKSSRDALENEDLESLKGTPICSLFLERRRDHYDSIQDRPGSLELYLDSDATDEHSTANIFFHERGCSKKCSEIVGVEEMIEKFKLCTVDAHIPHPANSKSLLVPDLTAVLSELCNGENMLQDTIKKQNVDQDNEASVRKASSEHIPTIPTLITFEDTRIPSSLQIKSPSPSKATLPPRITALVVTDPNLDEGCHKKLHHFPSKKASSKEKDSGDSNSDHTQRSPKKQHIKVPKLKTNAPKNDVFDRLYNSRRKSYTAPNISTSTMEKEIVREPFKTYHYKEYRTVHSVKPENTKNIYCLTKSTNRDNAKSKKIKSTTTNDVFNRLYNSRKPANKRKKIESTEERMILW